MSDVCSVSRRLSVIALARLCLLAKAVLLIAMLAVVCFGEDMPKEAKPVSKEQLATFLNSLVPSNLDWAKSVGPDFVIYYGRARAPLTGHVGFYLGGWPSFKPDPSAPIIDGQLGIYSVKWQKKVAADGSLRVETVISLHSDYWKAHVWAEAKDQADLDKLLEELTVLPTFQTMPRPVGIP